MNAPPLTAGAVAQMSNGVQVGSPTVQLLDVKQIQPTGPGAQQTRYRRVLSDARAAHDAGDAGHAAQHRHGLGAGA